MVTVVTFYFDAIAHTALTGFSRTNKKSMQKNPERNSEQQ